MVSCNSKSVSKVKFATTAEEVYPTEARLRQKEKMKKARKVFEEYKRKSEPDYEGGN